MDEGTKAKFDFLRSLLTSYTGNHSYSHARHELLILVTGIPRQQLQNQLTDVNIVSEFTGEGLVVPNLWSDQLPFYYDINTYVKDFTLKQAENDFGILTYLSGAYFDVDNKSFISDLGKVPGNDAVWNNIAYLQIREMLMDTNPNNVGRFANYSDTASCKIYTSSGTKGGLTIGYPVQNPMFNCKFNLTKSLGKLSGSLIAKGYVELFKSEIYDNVKDTEENERFPRLVQNIDIILENSDRNYDIYMSNFSFAKLKDSLKQEKIKYYNLTRDILSKIYGQITSVPIAISASAFATYKVDDIFTLMLILLGFAIYSIFIFALTEILKAEINSIESDFYIEESAIKKESTLKKASIIKEVDIIKSRIGKTKMSIYYFKIMFIFLSGLFLLFIVNQMLKEILFNKLFIVIAQIFYYLAHLICIKA